VPSFLSSVRGAEAKVGSLQQQPSPWLVSIPLFAASSAIDGDGASAAIFFRMAWRV